MGRLIEQREYQAPKWEKFHWSIDGAWISGFLSVVEEGEKVKRARVAINVPSDAQVINFGSITRAPVDWDSNSGGPKWEPNSEEMIEISWYSPRSRVGRNILIPREVVESREEGGPLRIQVVDVSLYSNNSNNEPTVNDIS